MRPWLTSGRLLPGLTVRRLLTATPAARLLNKTMSAETADNAGMPRLKQFHMVNIDMFKHPKYYKELRKRNKSDQVISSGSEGSALPQRAPGQGQQHQASSAKLTKSQASSGKHQAPSSKRQA